MDTLIQSILIADVYGSAGDVTAYHREGKLFLRKKSTVGAPASPAQLTVQAVHHRALEAWRGLSDMEQHQWGIYAQLGEPHRPPFDHSSHITGHNLFVSAYHGFATLGNEHVPVPRAFEKFPPFVVEVGGASVVEGLLVLPLSVVIDAALTPERYRLLVKIQLTRPGKGRNPGKMRNVLADRPCGSSSVNLFIDPSIWGLNLQQYQVHARFILLDTVTGYRSQYHQLSFLIGL